jgi:hypothetical protein
MKNTMTFHILWPERNTVAASKISMWYSDAVANGELGDDYLGISDDTPYLQALALHKEGVITLRDVRYD